MQIEPTTHEEIKAWYASDVNFGEACASLHEKNGYNA
jgi:hypothetical protein